MNPRVFYCSFLLFRNLLWLSLFSQVSIVDNRSIEDLRFIWCFCDPIIECEGEAFLLVEEAIPLRNDWFEPYLIRLFFSSLRVWFSFSRVVILSVMRSLSFSVISLKWRSSFDFYSSCILKYWHSIENSSRSYWSSSFTSILEIRSEWSICKSLRSILDRAYKSLM